MPSPITLASYRGNGIAYRTGQTAIDKLSTPAQPTLADVGTGGSLAFNTTYNVAVAAVNHWGVTTPCAVASITTANDASNTHQIQITLAAVANAEGYEINLSTDAAPKEVVRITEAQRAAGCTVTAQGTVSGTSPGANKINIQLAGTGVASNLAPFIFNTAYTPQLIPNPIPCAGWKKAHVHVSLSVTDLRILPNLAFLPFTQDQISSDWHAGELQIINPLTANGLCLEMDYVIDVDGAANLALAIDTIAGQSAQATFRVEMS